MDQQNKKKRPKKQFVVELNGVRCGFTLKNCFKLKRGILAPLDGATVKSFAIMGEKQALKAVAVTNRILGILRGSMVDEMPAVKNALTGGGI